MKVVDLGLIGYERAVEVQRQRLAEVADGAEDTLFVLEHTPVITLGRNAGDEHLHASPEFLAAQGVDLVKSARGGDITCHFPGQLVAYPIFHVAGHKGGLHGFFHDLEEVIIRSLARFGVIAARRQGFPGVWIDHRKIASIGIAVRKWVTWHGLSINVARDLNLFSLITLCGLGDAEPTSVNRELARTGAGESVAVDESVSVAVDESVSVAVDESVSVKDMKHAVIEAFGTIFG